MLLFGLLGLIEHRVAGPCGQPILPRSLLGLPGMKAGLGGLFATMAIFGGWLFSLALELQDALGESPLRAGLTFVPCGSVAFALVSLNWGGLPARYHEGRPMAGFAPDGRRPALVGAADPLRRRPRSVAVRGAGGGRRRHGRRRSAC